MHSAQITQVSGLVTVGYSASALSHSVLLFLCPPPDSEPWRLSTAVVPVGQVWNSAVPLSLITTLLASDIFWQP